MSLEIDEDTIVAEIMNGYPDDEWMDRCRASLPDYDDGSIMAIIEILSGGDCIALEQSQ